MIKRIAAFKREMAYGKELLMLPMVCYITASQVQEHLADREIYISVWWIVIAGVLLSWIVGWIMIKMGLMSEEMRYNWSRNPEWKERDK
jgi:hypothetical protein